MGQIHIAEDSLLFIKEECHQVDLYLRSIEGYRKESSDALRPEILAVVKGISRNFIEYTEKGLKGSGKKNEFGERSGFNSFLDVYRKPILKNHDEWGDPIGRIEEAWYTSGGIIVIPKISQWEYIQKIKDGDFHSVSIGYKTDAAVCSICGNDVVKTKEWCDHIKGERYGKKKELCTWAVGNMWFRELSFVNVPGVPAAGVLKTDTSSSGIMQTQDDKDGGDSE